LRPDRLAQSGEFDIAVGVGGDFADREAAHDGGAGLVPWAASGTSTSRRAWSRGRRDRRDHRHPGEFALGAAIGVSETACIRHFPQHLLQVMQQARKP